MQCGHALVVEWYLATYENIEYDAETPNVDLGTGVDLGVE